MELETASPEERARLASIRDTLALEGKVNGGLGWFYWIAGLSVINSVIYLAGGTLTFVVGLGATQFMDGLVTAVCRRMNGSTAGYVRIFGFGIDLLIAGVFAGCGWLGRKKYRTAVIAGMALYGLDACIFLYFQEWMSVAFHGFAFFCILGGLNALNQLLIIEKGPPAGAPGEFPPTQPPSAAPPAFPGVTAPA